MGKPLRVLIADDHEAIRDFTARSLEREKDIEIVGQAHDALNAFQLAIRLKPHVVLMDIEMPGTSCFDITRRLKEGVPETSVLLFSAYAHDTYIEQALAAGVAGYITKGDSSASVTEAIRKVGEGEAYFSPSVWSRIVISTTGVRLRSLPEKTVASTLTARELQVLRYLAQGMTNKEIASAMSLSVRTADSHVLNLMGKLKIHDRVKLATYAIRENLAST